MEENEILMYKQQLKQINTAIEQCITEDEKNELLALKVNITELLTLTDDQQDDPSTTQPDEKTDEFALFMSEMAKEGAVQNSTIQINANTFDAIEGKKCRAPHEHQWGSIAYHNAMICSVAENDRKVRVLFINPTHQEMLPCPYYFDSECKFPEDKCRFSHGELVLSTDLQDYIEPKFDQLVIGSPILAKKEDDLWYRASIRRIYNDRCFIKFESNQKEMEVKLEHMFPLEGDIDSDGLDEEGVINEVENDEDVINMSLVITPANQGLGDWEKHTKGIGSKLMQQMGYITGTGLGRHADGRINPVTAIILPAGKSLDHCMKLRENAGGDKDLFSVERKLKRIQKKQELRNQRAYESDQSKSDVFNFINKTLSSEDGADSVKVRNSKHRQEVKKETCRNLNVAGLQVDENIRRVERDLEKVRDSLSRHKNVRSQMHKSLNEQLQAKYSELSRLQSEALNIRNEQSLRSDKKKLTVF